MNVQAQYVQAIKDKVFRQDMKDPRYPYGGSRLDNPYAGSYTYGYPYVPYSGNTPERIQAYQNNYVNMFSHSYRQHPKYYPNWDEEEEEQQKDFVNRFYQPEDTYDDEILRQEQLNSLQNLNYDGSGSYKMDGKLNKNGKPKKCPNAFAQFVKYYKQYYPHATFEDIAVEYRRKKF
jgi:hypothetical protein